MISLVTGGTGYFGGRLVSQLVERGDQVWVLHRKGSDLSRLPPGVIPKEGELTSLESFRRAAEGCDRIFHAAALVKTWTRDPADFERVNVTGTSAICRAAKELQVRLVYTSSFFALGPTGNEPVSEEWEHPKDVYCTEYERTKTLAYRLVQREIENGLDAVILLPSMIYGPGPLTQGNYVTRLADDLRRKRLPGIPGDGNQRLTLAYVDDVAAGHMTAAEKAEPGAKYILGGPHATVNELLKILSSLLAVKPPRTHIPIGFLKAIGWISEGAAWVTGHAPQVTRGVAETYRHHWAYDSSKAVCELGYTITPLEEGLRRVVESLTSRHR